MPAAGAGDVIRSAWYETIQWRHDEVREVGGEIEGARTDAIQPSEQVIGVQIKTVHARHAPVYLMYQAVSSIVKQGAAADRQRLWCGSAASSTAPRREWRGPVADREGSFASRAASSLMEQAEMAMGDVSKKASTRNLAVERKNLVTVCRSVYCQAERIF